MVVIASEAIPYVPLARETETTRHDSRCALYEDEEDTDLDIRFVSRLVNRLVASANS